MLSDVRFDAKCSQTATAAVEHLPDDVHMADQPLTRGGRAHESATARLSPNSTVQCRHPPCHQGVVVGVGAAFPGPARRSPAASLSLRHRCLNIWLSTCINQGLSLIKQSTQPRSPHRHTEQPAHKSQERRQLLRQAAHHWGAPSLTTANPTLIITLPPSSLIIVLTSTQLRPPRRLESLRSTPIKSLRLSVAAARPA